MAEAQSEKFPGKEKRGRSEKSLEELREIREEKEMNQGIMLVFLGNAIAKKMLDELLNGYACEFIISPLKEVSSDYLRIFHYEKEISYAFIGVPEGGREAMVVLYPVTKNINELPFGERMDVNGMLLKISADFKIPIVGGISI